ncbi:MAG TPA: TIGR03118 family protein [Gemmatimonadales bacterium]|nr:TIGR03118 family protein [Gemmatimonadales bacterium]
MSVRRLVGVPLAVLGALSLACSGERPTAPSLTPPSFSSASAPAAAAASRFYQQHNLVSDGAVPADLVDPDLVNAWGLVSSATSPFWVSDNGTDRSTLYNGKTGAKIALTVAVDGAPTGVVFNGGAGFVVSNGSASAAARFIFATEGGTIRGWNPGVAATQAVVAVDSSGAGAVYKGLAIAATAAGDRLYATNFHAGRVEVYDAAFHAVPGGFSDPTLPSGYAPFGIRNLGGTIYVSYALQDADQHDDVAGVGHGFVNAFDTQGNLLHRVASRGRLNSPWGLAIAPADSFGQFNGNLLVGNFGDGHINAFDLGSSGGNGELQQRGQLHSADGQPLTIDGLWAIAFGNGAAAGPTTTLFFTAGPFGEQHGLFGTVVATTQPH